MLSNAYFLAKFRFDTAENEPAKNLQNFAKFANFADPNPLTLMKPGDRAVRADELRGAVAELDVRPRPTGSGGRLLRVRRRQRASVGKISAKCCSFSAVSAPIFARKYAFCSIFQNLPDSQAEIFEI